MLQHVSLALGSRLGMRHLSGAAALLFPLARFACAATALSGAARAYMRTDLHCALGGTGPPPYAPRDQPDCQSPYRFASSTMYIVPQAGQTR